MTTPRKNGGPRRREAATEATASVAGQTALALAAANRCRIFDLTTTLLNRQQILESHQGTPALHGAVSALNCVWSLVAQLGPPGQPVGAGIRWYALVVWNCKNQNDIQHEVKDDGEEVVELGPFLRQSSDKQTRANGQYGTNGKMEPPDHRECEAWINVRSPTALKNH